MDNASDFRIDSRVVVQEFIKLKERQIENLKKFHENNRQNLAEAPKNRISDPEPSRLGYGQTAAVITEQIKDARDAIKLLKELPTGFFTRISLGCIFTLECDNNQETYLMIPQHGGCSAEILGRKITCMSVQAPIALVILNLKEGETVEFRGKNYKITRVR